MFATAEFLKDREALVKEFLTNREILKKRQVDCKVTIQHQGESFEWMFQPVVAGVQKAAESAVATTMTALAETHEAINQRQDD